jgi:SAM-dependent methyltransferase
MSSVALKHSRATAAALVDGASTPYRASDLFGYYRARGKLRGDPAFTGILRLGLLVGAQRILDLGCGQGLLAAWLVSAQSRFDERPHLWPSEWLAPPRPTSFRGIELRWRDVQRARSALGTRADFEVGDITNTDFGSVDAIVILDVLHYIDYQSQLRLLDRARAALAAEGVLLLRVGDAGSGIRFTLGKYIDQTVLLTHHHRTPRVYCRSAREWQEVLVAAGFQCEARPMSAGTPFANILLIGRPRKKLARRELLTGSLTAP